ncbi:MAG: FtsH protease activity modulator HflK [Candidatus Eisenbacteria bacterium]|nr:FtsH protease activity modulator HflK [Candidatus Latescibacterota bacterium]MBD3302022.1 FtsH protease activity modulator HflK [Candidatus Eisenbacteria bacterium]
MSNEGFGNQIPVQIPKLPGGLIRFVVLGVIVLILLLTSFYTVSPEQIGVVMRFGEYVRSTDPGLNWKLPFGIERVTKVPVQRQLKEEFGFRTISTGGRTQYTQRGLEGESNMLTGDLNVAVVEWVVQYRIVDPYKFLFRVRSVRETFRSMTEAVVRKVVGDRTVNEVLTVGRQEVASLVERNLQKLCDQYETGIKVEQVVLQDVNPPDPVKPSFNEVNQAQQEREKLINEAQSEYNRVIPRARGQAQQTIEEARGYALDRINRARGDSARFAALYNAYRLSPDVTRKRIYLETMNTILPQVSRKIIVDDEISGLLPLLNLGDALQRKEGN